MSEEPQLTAEETLVVLRENASRLAELEGVGARQASTAPEPDEWSAREVLAHIRACCDVWGRNIARILADENATFAGMNPRAWMRKTDYLEWPFDAALSAFATQRQELLHTLEGLTPAQWEWTATVTSYGQANERTLRSYASQLAKHERTHVKQIALAVAPKSRAS